MNVEKSSVRQSVGIGRTARDRILAVLVLAGILWTGPLGDWLEGRSNGVLSSPFAFLSWVGYLVVGLWAPARIWKTMHGPRAAMQCVRGLLLPTVVLLVCILPRVILQQNGFLLGFASWAKGNTDVSSIRQWGMVAHMDLVRTTSSPLSWWAGPSLEAVTVEIPRAAWPQSISRLEPDEVHILSDRSALVLWWWRGTWGYTRALIVAMSGSTGPPGVGPGSGLSDVWDGVWVYIRYPERWDMNLAR